MYCGKCGTQIADDSNFCFRCGAKVNIPSDSAALVQEQITLEEESSEDKELEEDQKENRTSSVWKILFVVGVVAVIYYIYSGMPEKATARNSDVVENRQTYAHIGDEVSVKNFVYRVNAIEFRKSLGNDIYRQRADGVYLIVDLSLFNRDKVPHTIDNSMFRLTDVNGRQFEYSGEAITALLMDQEETLFLKQCNPQIHKQGFLAFEVPGKGTYFLQLSGGDWKGEKAVVRLSSS